MISIFLRDKAIRLITPHVDQQLMILAYESPDRSGIDFEY